MKNPSPLLVWKLLSIVIAAMIVLMLLQDPMQKVVQLSDSVLARTLSELHFKEDQLGVLFFGNSLMNRALPVKKRYLSEKLAEELRKNGYNAKPVAAVEVTTGGVNIWRLQELADRLIATNPSVIVLQGEMVVARHRQRDPIPPITAGLNRLGAWSGVINLKIFGESGRRGPANKKKKPSIVFDNDTKTRRPEGQQRPATLEVAKTLWANQVASATQPEYGVATNFVRKVSALGIRVVVVELPVSETAARFATEQYLRDRSKVIQKLTESGVIHLAYPRILPDEYFRDYSHLNGKGRDECMRWLFPALAQALLENEITR